ncbi:MAG: T9SS type A sorting domain-containing protein, partial [Flavobacteriales bacterium]
TNNASPSGNLFWNGNTDAGNSLQFFATGGGKKYEWDFGDGSANQTVTDNYLGMTDHTYSSGGTYQVTVTITNNCNNSNTISRNITIDGSGGTTDIEKDEEKTTKEKNNLKVYPNPTKGYFNIQLNSETAQKMMLSLYNNMGKKVYDKEIHEAKNINRKVDLRSLAKGIYFLKIKTENNTYSKKVIFTD